MLELGEQRGALAGIASVSGIEGVEDLSALPYARRQAP